MKHLKIEDLERLSREIKANSDGPRDWAEKIGIDFDVLDRLANVACHSVAAKTVEKARQQYMEQGFEENDIVGDGESFGVKMEVGDVIKEACLSMFVMGFEVNRQFGGVDVR